MLLRPVGLVMQVSVLLANMYSTLHTSQVALYFDALPPSIEDYLSGVLD